jgi:DNA mismatch repair protein MutS2
MQKKAAAGSVSEAKAKYKKAINSMYDTANPVNERGETTYRLPRDIKRGDDVLVFSLDKTGKVVSDPDNAGNVFVSAGNFKMKVNISGLRLIEPDEQIKEKEAAKPRKLSIRTDREAATELDIRGMNIDEGAMETDMFIDSAVMAGLHTVRIIHGKGTGVLRKGIQAHLKTNRTVKSFRSGVYGEGEDGVTIVELK